MNIRKVVPVIIGVILLLLGIGFASQGAGMMGGSALMDNNPTFIYVGGLVAIIGIALIAFGALWKPKIPASAKA
jgi:xanthine/uracil permease